MIEYGASMKIGNCNQYGYLIQFSIPHIKVPIVNKNDVNKFKEGDWVKVKGTIGEYTFDGVEIAPMKDGSLPIEFE